MTPRTEVRLPAALKKIGRSVPEITLIDVGCSGGLDTTWKPLFPWITAYAVDPLVSEIQRLRAAETSGKVHYIDGFVVGPAGYATPPNPALNWFGEVSALAAHKALQSDYIENVFNSGAAVVHSENRFTVDELVDRRGLDHIDFLKTDTDGFDHAVLDGARTALKSALGICAEATFATEGGGSVFRDIDRLMAEEGFALAGLRPALYTRSALPGLFIDSSMADEDRGAPSWAEFFYLRDVAKLPADLDTVIKFAMIAELIGAPDIAAQALLKLRGENTEVVTPLLDALVAYSGKPEAKSYDELMASFHKNPRTFAPQVVQTQSFAYFGPKLDPSKPNIGIFGDGFVLGVDSQSWVFDVDVPGFNVINGGMEGAEIDDIVAHVFRVHGRTPLSCVAFHPGFQSLLSKNNSPLHWDSLFHSLQTLGLPIALFRLTADLHPAAVEAGYAALYRPDHYSPTAFTRDRNTARKFQDAVAQKNKLIERACKWRGYTLIDLDPVLAPKTAGDVTKHFFDVVHPRPEIYPQIAAAVAARLKPLV